MFLKNYVFISHSSQNKDIAEQLCVFLSGLGVKKQNLFCSSIIGQGIDNGEKLNEAIASAISKSKLFIFLLSKDFLASSYCMEELGIGWYLRQTGRANCFYLVLPDVSLSELQGFVNSRIDKFSFVNSKHRDDLGLFAENLCNAISIKPPKHSELLNLENTFFSAVQFSLEKIIEAKDQTKNEQEELAKKNDLLYDQVDQLKNKIEQLHIRITEKDKLHERDLLLKEYNTIHRHFIYLGFGNGISETQVKAVSKEFWMGMMNRYLKLEELLRIQDEDKNYSMELLFANLLSAYDETEEAYIHFKNYLINTDSSIYISYLRNVKISYTDHLQEIIEILEDKIKKTPRGIVQDSYKETAAYLSETYGNASE